MAAVLVSVLSAGFSALQYRLAVQAREDAKQAAAKQAKDMDRSLQAAEDSTAAARTLAEAGKDGLLVAN
jgi:hypothetical protein